YNLEQVATTADLSELLNAKLDVIQKQNQIYSIFPDPEMKNFVLNSLADLSSSITFNDLATMASIQSLMENALQLNSPTSILSQGESQVVADVVTNELSFLGKTDCKCESELCKQAENSTIIDINKVASSSLNDLMPNDPPRVIQTDLFNIAVAKATPCTL